MSVAIFLLVLVISYLIGSIPFGLLLVKLLKGEDIRNISSGRTGGTNAMRAAGFWVGLATALLDILKGASGVWIAELLLPGSTWLKVFAPLMAILGHNYSIFLIDRKDGRIRFGGGAGGAPCVGGAIGLWWPSLLVIIPLGFIVLFGLGYASVATMSIGLVSMMIFLVLAAFFQFPWEFILYGVLAEALLLWALRPNIKRLLNGTERLVGWRAKRAAPSRR
ncbi:MAG TPA: glycerol-3-phosphate acyltransferase [Anaerolineales bacterium]|nr:glycerol-3-phosphate acyltransferase [Anaerolineales bacterium]